MRKLLLHILFEKYINILALEMASLGNWHCVSALFCSLYKHLFDHRQQSTVADNDDQQTELCVAKLKHVDACALKHTSDYHK